MRLHIRSSEAGPQKSGPPALTPRLRPPKRVPSSFSHSLSRGASRPSSSAAPTFTTGRLRSPLVSSVLHARLEHGGCLPTRGITSALRGPFLPSSVRRQLQRYRRSKLGSMAAAAHASLNCVPPAPRRPQLPGCAGARLPSRCRRRAWRRGSWGRRGAPRERHARAAPPCRRGGCRWNP